MKFKTCLCLMLFSVSTMAQSLDRHHLLLDSQLKDSEKSPYAFSDFKEAVAHLTDETTLYVKPGVYWVDDPDTPEVLTGKDGNEPFGIVIRTKKLHFIGLDKDPRNIVFASQRGQMQGAVGNFTMFDFWCNELIIENLTMGNYCNVDLDYPLNPAMSRPKRSNAITQAHVGYVHGQQMRAKNVHFISRLNLNPLNGAVDSYYEDCHFECTDDALNGTAVYRHCTFDFYGQKPFWSTFGKGAMFIDCDFNVKGENREMYFCKQGGPVTVVNCRCHAPSDSVYIGWTAYPQRWLRCYQDGFTLNGKSYTIGARQSENTVLLSNFLAKQIPYLEISQKEATLLTGADTLMLSSERGCQWRIQKGFESYIQMEASNDGSVCLIPTNFTDEIADFCVESYTADGRVAACQLIVRPSIIPAPTILTSPTIVPADSILHLDYTLGLEGHRDESLITWYRDSIPVSTSHLTPQRTYHLSAADKGHVITAKIEPKSNRSDYGSSVQACYTSNHDFPPISVLETDFSDFPCNWQTEILPGFWTVDGYKPADTSAFPWSFDKQKPMWEYGEGFNGAVGMGLLQAQRGARLMYMPLSRHDGDMSLTLDVDPTKTAGQGFGSATGQYMDICIKFDPQTLTGYALRIIRTTKYSKAVDFYLVVYKDGHTEAISEPISSTCYRTGCTISMKVEGQQLIAHVETKTPKPADSQLPHRVDLSAQIESNAFGGVAIQHTGSCGESTTMLHHLKVIWQ
jgi:hypothetical protein